MPLCCPDDRTSLDPPTGDGSRRCPRCERVFPVVDGILCLLPGGAAWTAPEREAVEMERGQRDREAGAYDRLPGLRLLSLREIPLTLGPLAVRSADRVLEVGCGTGRMTTRLARTGATVLAMDHSLESLRVLRGKLASHGASTVQLVQADAARLPVADGWATRALTCQMLEHLPTPAMRERAVAELARALAPGGRLAISGYWHAPFLRWLLAAEGRHSGAIYFHRFTRKEFAQLLEPHFAVERLTAQLVYILLAHCLKKGSGFRVQGSGEPGSSEPRTLNPEP